MSDPAAYVLEHSGTAVALVLALVVAVVQATA